MKREQEHGFIFENIIRRDTYNIKEEPNSTNKHDINKKDNKINDSNISIKCTTSNTVCLSSIQHLFNYNFNEKNEIIIIQLKQNSEYKVVKKILKYDYNKDFHKILFGECSKEDINEYCNKIKNIKNKKFDYKEEKKKLQKEKNMLITINPKVSKTNQRVQCSITFNKLKKLEKFKISESKEETPNILENIKLPKKIISKSRITSAKLKKMCKDNNIKGYSNKNKNELINLLKENAITV